MSELLDVRVELINCTTQQTFDCIDFKNAVSSNIFVFDSLL